MKKFLFAVLLIAMVLSIAASTATVKCAFQSSTFAYPRKAVAIYKCWYTWDGKQYAKMYELVHTFPINFTLGQNGY